MLPALFVAHGAPLLAIEDNDYTQFLHSLGNEWQKPRAIVLLSAHWESPIQQVSDAETFETIYDFGGFPEELYRIRYPAKGDSAMTEEIMALLKAEGVPAEADSERGLDHGAWVVLKLLYPAADIPVIAMSVNPRLTPAEQYKIGASLAPLREQDVLIVASGGTVHNLRELRMIGRNETVDQWAVEFDKWLEDRLLGWDTSSLFAYADVAPAAELAVPPYGNEHFIPLFYAMGTADREKQAQLLHRGYRYGNLSHSVWQFG
ncbi:dioxygenase [Indiicoccus explosivorum]|uniref:dioxygenase family protein n=1 Tax=Indiicoccus explosivorum TaxID=1917864 RepID=UPI000B4415B5|nr:class III extradiol ring-cleavage dioxygenase [Indiicoccus explosivorum]